MTSGAAAELARRIRLGEDSALELKSIRVDGTRVRSPHRNGLADELTALANGRGGTLVLGVDDETRQCRASRSQTWMPSRAGRGKFATT